MCDISDVQSEATTHMHSNGHDEENPKYDISRCLEILFKWCTFWVNFRRWVRIFLSWNRIRARTRHKPIPVRKMDLWYLVKYFGFSDRTLHVGSLCPSKPACSKKGTLNALWKNFRKSYLCEKSRYSKHCPNFPFGQLQCGTHYSNVRNRIEFVLPELSVLENSDLSE